MMSSIILALRHLSIFLVLFFLACQPEKDETHICLLSPDKSIRVDVELLQGKPKYSVYMDDELLIRPSTMGYNFRGMSPLNGPFSVIQYQTEIMRDDWKPVWGQENLIQSLSSLTKIELQEINSPKRLLNLYFQVFDDGLGFRYEIPEQLGIDSVFIRSENTTFELAQESKVWWIPADYDSYEKVYTQSPLSEIRDSVHTPLTMITGSGHYLSIHEADLTRYASMTLKKDEENSLNLICELVPWPDGDKVKTQLPMRSPWRTIMLGREATDLLESRLILNLNEANVLRDVSWIRPMKYIGIWWGLHIGKETWVQGERHGATTENTKRYIDFASVNNIDGVLVEGWNHDWEQYGHPEAFKFTQPYDDFDIQALSKYASEKGVVLIGHHETGGEAPFYDQQLEASFAFCKDNSIPAVKSGYAGAITPQGQHHHGQWMVEHYRRVVEMAAKYQVTLDVHEPIKPTGIERTWPHMMTREGARGMEWNAWSEGNPPDHTTILPFTRLLAGPMDYTPGIFDLYFDKFKPDNRVHTTLAKQLALMVIMYSPLQMAADLIENYEEQPAFQFIRDLETDWAESRYLAAEIGQHITVARRHGEDWFIGAITNETGRNIELRLNDLIHGKMVAEVYADGPEANWESNPYDMHIGSYLVQADDEIKIDLAPGGGLAIRIRPIENRDERLSHISEMYPTQKL